MAEVTPEAPVPVVIYLPVTPVQFTEGLGPALTGAVTAQVRIATGHLGAATIRVALPQAHRVPADREQAKALMGRATAARRGARTGR